MRSKTILKTVAFVVAFGFSTAFVSLFIPKTQVETSYVIFNDHNSTSCFLQKGRSSNAAKITAFITQDKRNGLESDRAIYENTEDVTSPFTSSSFPDYADSVERYVDDSSSMKTRGLPNDFQVAWREHMKAWRDYSEFLNNMKKSSNQEASSAEEFSDTNEFYNVEISRTWYEVLHIGETYGADVSE